MMQFNLKADISFEAEDIDDALLELSKHFSDVMESELEHVGEISLRRVSDVVQEKRETT